MIGRVIIMEERILYDKIGYVLRKMGIKFTLRRSEKEKKNYISINYRKKNESNSRGLVYSLLIICDEELQIVSLTVPEIPAFSGEISDLNELVEKINFLNDLILYGNLVYSVDSIDSKVSNFIVTYNYAFPFIKRSDELYNFMNTILNFLDQFIYETSMFLSKSVSMEEIIQVVNKEPVTVRE